MTISEITNFLETFAPLSLQENYDNSGLIVGNKNDTVSGILVCLDSLEAIVEEAIQINCNLIIAHHPIIFSGIKKLNGNNYIERTIIKAINNNIAIWTGTYTGPITDLAIQKEWSCDPISVAKITITNT